MANSITVNSERPSDERVAWVRSTPYFLMHLVPLGALVTGVHWSAFIVMGALFFTRMWFIGAGLHRYFAHRSYKMGRVMQFLMALGATTAVQKGPLWWAAHHRHHHKYSDQPEDIHSPKRGFWWSHMGWILCTKYDETRLDLVPDLAKFPELRWLDRHPFVAPVALMALVFGLGFMISGTIAGALGMLFIGFFLSTVLLSHTTYTINSLSHVFGTRRFATRDTSRNNWALALITGGEGWHNNHHHYQQSVKQGYRWHELDTTYYVLWVLSKLGLVSGLREAPEREMSKHLVSGGAADIGMFEKHWDKAVRALISARAATGEMAEEQKQKIAELYAATRVKVEEICRISESAPSV